MSVIKQYLATYKDEAGGLQKFNLLAYDLRRATMSAAELIPASAKLISVIHNPDF